MATLSAPTQDPDNVDGVTVLQALSDPVRLEIVRQLAGCGDSGEIQCGEIRVPVQKSTASHHFKTLLGAGIITEREAGRNKYFQLRREELDRRFPGLIESVLNATGSAAERSV
jgi:DNA-binding transcriptional ArsR family regulator